MRFTGVTLLLFIATGAQADAQHVYFGDTHLHSAYSADASLMGNPTADPDTAYRYARGFPVVHPNTRSRVQIHTPLDFLAVSDHAEFLGVVPAMLAGDARVGNSPMAREFVAFLRDGQPGRAFRLLLSQALPGRLDPGFESVEISQSTWGRIVAAAERHNDPGVFTALIGWEWSAMPGEAGASSGPNLHRVVLLREGAEKAEQFFPYSSFESPRPEDLWAWLGATSKSTGATFLAIPHNMNIGMGKMFDVVDSDGRPISAAYAKQRMRWEPVAEVTQVKGDSETHPALSPDDEFAGYELFTTAGTQPSPADFARSSLRRGLEIEAKTGVNPYQFGMIGASDAHTGLASVEEDNYHGKWGGQSTPERMLALVGGRRGADMGAAGLAAVWANENTREEIFAAFQRREVYATTGTRLRVRFFGGFDFARSDLAGGATSKVGYTRGVPMGSELPAHRTKAPRFIVQAMKDPVAANLDRIQIVKGWLDDFGVAHEQVYDVAGSNGRSVGRDGRLPPVGSTVDLETGRYTNRIGASELSAVWEDPDYDPGRSAFYYARVLEIPTPRHSLLDSIALDQPHPVDLPATVQERAYTSPIWVRP